VEEIRRDLRTAIAVFERLEDEEGIATAWLRMAESEWLPCRYEDAREELDHAIEHARRSGNQGLLHYTTAMSLATDVFGPTRPAEGLARLEATLPTLGSTGFVPEHLALVHRGVFGAMLGDLDGARRLLDEAEAVARRKGATFWLSAGLQLSFYVEEFGDPVRALAAAREAFELQRASGDEGHASTDAGNLARVLCRVGRFDEAETYAAIAVATTQEDVISQVTGLCAQALIRSAAGEHDEAVALGRDAVGRLAETQSPDFDAIAWLDLAKVLRAAGREAEALDAAQRALALHERKGNLPAVAAAEAFLGSAG
jgi:tetratricopeptide (TPR) repeat protein